MTSIFLFAATDGSSSVAGDIAETFGVSGPLVISQTIVFVLVILALRAWAFGPVLSILDKRKAVIAEGLENAKRQKKELESAEEQKKDILYRANITANKLVEEARAAAAETREREAQKAVNQAEDIVRKAREAAEADRRRMMDEARQQIGALVVQTTAQVTGKTLTEEDKNRLIGETVNHLAV